MIYQVTLPHPALQPYIREYLLIDFDFRGLREIPTKLLPARAEQSIILYPGEAFTKVNTALNKRLVMPHTLVQGQPLTVWHHHYPRTFSLVKVSGKTEALFRQLAQLTPKATLEEAQKIHLANECKIVGPKLTVG